MQWPWRKSQVIAFVLSMAGLMTPAAAGKKRTQPAGAMDAHRQAVHALNRLTFGPRPGDVEHVMQVGVDQWIDLQLHPEKINDSALDARLAPFRTLRMNNREIAENFPSNQVIKRISDGKSDLPRDPVKRAVYEAQLERFENKQDAKNAVPQEGRGPKSNQAEADFAELEIRHLQSLPPDRRFDAVIRMSPDEQRALLAAIKGHDLDVFAEGFSAQQKETMMALRAPAQVVVTELMQAKLLREIYSERQLEEVMTDFWFNHFNVFINKGADRFLLTGYERDVIRPHALGKFEDLLTATAKSPAMLFYLDNWQSMGPNSEIALGISPRGYDSHAPRPQARRKATGLNENYGRELMELHTLSVNGGYSQEDVTEVAKVFTGWTIDKPQQGGKFKFDPRMHEPGDKIVLGHRIKSSGEKEGIELLHMLAHNPKTARFVCQKLAMRFVADDPPPALVDRMAHTFLKKDGDIREVLKTMLKSPEFWSPEMYRAKVKTPLEFVVSALRATGTQVDDARPLVSTLNSMGMMPYGMQPPTGYSMKAETWVSSSALLGRMNFALALATGKLRGITAGALPMSTPDPQAALASLESVLLGGDVSKETHESIAKRLDDPQISRRRLDDASRPANVAAIEGLILGSPDFQRR